MGTKKETENKIDNVELEVPTEIKLNVKQLKTKGTNRIFFALIR